MLPLLNETTRRPANRLDLFPMLYADKTRIHFYGDCSSERNCNFRDYHVLEKKKLALAVREGFFRDSRGFRCAQWPRRAEVYPRIYI